MSIPPDARERFRRLTEVSRALTSAESASQVAQLAVQTAVDLVDADRVVLLLTDDDGAVTVPASHHVDAAAAEEFATYSLDDGMSARLAALLETTSDDFLGVPLVVDGQLTGMLAARTNTAQREEAEWLFAALADQTSVALEKTRLAMAATLRERVLGIVSHDLRNPINAISIAAQLLLRRPDLDAKAHHLLRLVVEGSARAGRMVHDLLDYTAASRGGGIAVDRRQCDLRPAVDQVVAELLIGHPDTAIVVNAPAAIHGTWDADRLAQAIGNVVSNAIRYATDRRVGLTIDCADEVVRVRVHNHGPVIALDFMAVMFEPMRRAVLEGENAGGQVGLGLYIVKNIVEAHGGHVAVTSTTADGTTVAFEVPPTHS